MTQTHTKTKDKFMDLDTQEIIERYNELTEARDLLAELTENLKGAEPDEREALILEIEDAQEGFGVEEAEELAGLQALIDEVGEDTLKDEVFIDSDSFVDHCREMLIDCGDLPRELPWFIEIDWSATAENVKADYSELDWNGRTYFYRSC